MNFFTKLFKKKAVVEIPPMPLVLGSLLSFVVFLSYPFIIVKRLKNEEAFLSKNLIGYSEYKQKVKYRLIPFIW